MVMLIGALNCQHIALFQDFEETLSLCEKYRFPSLFINQFFPRSGTPAARMPQIDRQEVGAQPQHYP